MKNNRRWVFIGVGFLVLVAIIGVVLGVNWDRNDKSEGLPRVEINLTGVSLEEINEESKELKYPGNEVTIYNNGEKTKYTEVEIKGRGNATWTWDKRPYQIKFERKVDVLGMGRARKWYLLANYKDATNLRTEVAFAVEEMLGMEKVMEGEFVELYVDGDYQGLYYLTQAMEVGKNGVNLVNPEGVLVEIDNIYGKFEEYYTSGNGDILTVKDMKDWDYEEVGMADFLKSYNKLGVALEEGDYKEVKELIDVESFAKYYLLSEFTANPDAYWTSYYMYKDGAEDKIHAGPGWDFDMALGNREWGGNNWLGERLYSPTETMVRRNELRVEAWEETGRDAEDFAPATQLSTVIYKLMEIPEFQIEVRRVFNERMAGRGRELVLRLESAAEKIREAALVDSEKWEKWDFDEETSALIEWVKARYDYFEQIYGGEGEALELL